MAWYGMCWHVLACDGMWWHIAATFLLDHFSPQVSHSTHVEPYSDVRTYFGMWSSSWPRERQLCAVISVSFEHRMFDSISSSSPIVGMSSDWLGAMPTAEHTTYRAWRLVVYWGWNMRMCDWWHVMACSCNIPTRSFQSPSEPFDARQAI